MENRENLNYYNFSCFGLQVGKGKGTRKAGIPQLCLDFFQQ